jgi:hypothetical protein
LRELELGAEAIPGSLEHTDIVERNERVEVGDFFVT